MSKENILRQAMGRSKLNQKDLAEHTGMTEPTMSKKLKNPNLITLLELERMNTVLKFTDYEMKTLIGGNG